MPRQPENHRSIQNHIRTVDTIFRAPVIVDETYHINGVVTDIDAASQLLEVDLTVTNDKGETRVFGTAQVYLPR